MLRYVICNINQINKKKNKIKELIKRKRILGIRQIQDFQANQKLFYKVFMRYDNKQ